MIELLILAWLFVVFGQNTRTKRSTVHTVGLSDNALKSLTKIDPREVTMAVSQCKKNGQPVNVGGVLIMNKAARDEYISNRSGK